MPPQNSTQPSSRTACGAGAASAAAAAGPAAPAVNTLMQHAGGLQRARPGPWADGPVPRHRPPDGCARRAAARISAWATVGARRRCNQDIGLELDVAMGPIHLDERRKNSRHLAAGGSGGRRRAGARGLRKGLAPHPVTRYRAPRQRLSSRNSAIRADGPTCATRCDRAAPAATAA